MGVRFRKSIKVAPGVKVNVGKKSAGVRIGGKHGGVSVNSKTGVRASASLPGTGLSYSTKVGGGKKSHYSGSSKSSNRGCGLGLIVLLLFIGSAFVAALYEVFGALGIILPVALIVAVVYFVKRRHSKAEEENTSSSLDETSEYTFVLTGNDSEDRQSLLHDLKIKLWVHGSKQTLNLEVDDIALNGCVTLGEISLGEIGENDLRWINENFSSINKLSGVRILGGATSIDGEPRPFVVEITAELAPGVIAPSFSSANLPEVKTYHNCNGDAVCYVSKSQKVHHGDCSAIDIDNCTPMLVEEAFALGYENCSKCFY